MVVADRVVGEGGEEILWQSERERKTWVQEAGIYTQRRITIDGVVRLAESVNSARVFIAAKSH